MNVAVIWRVNEKWKERWVRKVSYQTIVIIQVIYNKDVTQNQ